MCKPSFGHVSQMLVLHGKNFSYNFVPFWCWGHFGLQTPPLIQFHKADHTHHTFMQGFVHPWWGVWYQGGWKARYLIT